MVEFACLVFLRICLNVLCKTGCELHLQAPLPQAAQACLCGVPIKHLTGWGLTGWWLSWLAWAGMHRVHLKAEAVGQWRIYLRCHTQLSLPQRVKKNLFKVLSQMFWYWTFTVSNLGCENEGPRALCVYHSLIPAWGSRSGCSLGSGALFTDSVSWNVQQ